jgi:hypothetical protein
MCKSGECLPAAEKCNGSPDCSGGSDECDCHLREVVLSMASRFVFIFRKFIRTFQATRISNTTWPTSTWSSRLPLRQLPWTWIAIWLALLSRSRSRLGLSMSQMQVLWSKLVYRHYF